VVWVVKYVIPIFLNEIDVTESDRKYFANFQMTLAVIQRIGFMIVCEDFVVDMEVPLKDRVSGKFWGVTYLTTHGLDCSFVCRSMAFSPIRLCGLGS
jgi:hypothetical protein